MLLALVDSEFSEIIFISRGDENRTPYGVAPEPLVESENQAKGPS